MAETLADLRRLSDDELERRHDSLAASTVVGTNHYLREMGRRDQERAARAMTRLTEELALYTRRIEKFTFAVLVLTIVSVGAALVAVAVTLWR